MRMTTVVAAIGIAIITAGYGLGVWGYTLLRGWNVTLIDVFNPFYPRSSAGTARPAPPGTAPGG